ncbi:similar to Saccharomyces cerevisiae YGL245W GUS1 Glutamyl-tRNA synthetase (GluRS), forms a complex with methionyl-tRNA synthetase (Mes1p) and Arc1p [Maudiozyma saulgeensis]|uniref:glutamate--tRNA ligase n=1 Tax=Maudiozyma saulgeensis TaxID=1789683 RepID=A0A1X7QXH7_9SACH|nr:similar to Saccharomyces cerevisiae YGL245W GUS1 Glutamyl-tRNA synthetase (GluRS), forms a complex with methionyl-tRNA synthetase (Mes1p) and Arc1p [Kazachstania saulgeensis]
MSATLVINGKAPVVAYADLIAARIANNTKPESVKIEFVDDKKAAPSTFNGSTENTFQAIVDAFPQVFTDSNKEEVAKWIKIANEELVIKNFQKLSQSLEHLDAQLNLRTFILGGLRYSAADVACWGALRSNGMVGSIIKNKVDVNVSRWYTLFELDPLFHEAHESLTKSLQELKKAATSGKKKEVHKANFEIDLPDAKMGEVVTRFPPEPSGYLHIGHAKAALLNQYFAQEYKGKLIIRFDDTNPSKEKEEFQDSILEDLSLLGIKGDRITYSSDYFQEMYDMCVAMIKEGKAYCDDTPTEKMREERMDGIASARRERSVEENLKIFTEEMKNGTEEGLKNCVRAKIDYAALNKTLRDPVIYRCNLTPHHRTGSTWKIYPTYDFCVPIVDSIEGVTHALRTIEYRDRNAQYDWMLENLHLRKVHIWDFARVNFVRTLLSKRKLQWMVDKDLVSNWDDPRFPTVRGVRRRGMTVEGLRNFVLSQGPSRNVINLEWNLIWAFNKKVIDPVAARHTAIVEPVKLHIEGADAPETPKVEMKPKHKKNPAVGEKKVIYYKDVVIDKADAESLDDNEEVTLMDWGNVIITKKNVDGSLEGKLHLEGDFKKTKHKLTWLADTTDVVPVDLVDFDHLISKDKLEEDESFEDFLTPVTEFHTDAIADLNVKDMKVGEIIQFERKGYYRLDALPKDGKPYTFFTIPDGKAVNKYGAKK